MMRQSRVFGVWYVANYTVIVLMTCTFLPFADYELAYLVLFPFPVSLKLKRCVYAGFALNRFACFFTPIVFGCYSLPLASLIIPLIFAIGAPLSVYTVRFVEALARRLRIGELLFFSSQGGEIP